MFHLAIFIQWLRVKVTTKQFFIYYWMQNINHHIDNRSEAARSEWLKERMEDRSTKEKFHLNSSIKSQKHRDGWAHCRSNNSSSFTSFMIQNLQFKKNCLKPKTNRQTIIEHWIYGVFKRNKRWQQFKNCCTLKHWSQSIIIIQSVYCIKNKEPVLTS